MTSEPLDSRVLERLFATIDRRRDGDPSASYTARLFADGRAKIARKTGEEALEVVIAALSESQEKLAAESADLLYHLLVLWADAGVRPNEVWEELARREGVSGLAEKAARPSTRRETRITAMTYDDSNIFAKILRGEIPCEKVYEDDYALAFNDIRPLAPVHILVIPKGPYVSLDDLTAEASPEFVGGFFQAVGEVARRTGVVENGYRILANNGGDANQEVMHYHVHIFAGRPLGGMLKKA